MWIKDRTTQDFFRILKDNYFTPMINHSFDATNKILRVTYTGEVTVEEFYGFGSFLKNNEQLPRSLNILVDARKATYNFSDDEIHEILPHIREHVKPYKQVKMAMIHEKPTETAYSLLLEKRGTTAILVER